MTALFEARGLHKSFGSLVVTSDVSLELPAGRRHGLIGPNGAGKTTLFNLIAGELAPDAGRVLLDGEDITRRAPDGRARRGLGRSFQRNNLFVDLTVRQNLEIAVAIRRGIGHRFWRRFSAAVEVQDVARACSLRLGLEDVCDRRVRELSYGTQRQLEVGLALAVEPKLLLLDEPTAGMSPEETTSMLALIQSLPAELTVLIIEHDMDVLFEVAERITVLDYGRVLLEDTPLTVRGSDEVRRRYLGEAP